jgi:hypothetical protein
MTISGENLAVNRDEEIIEQRMKYLCQADAVARELCRLASVSDRTLVLLTDTGADAQLLDAVQQKSNDILALQQQLRDLWAPFLAGKQGLSSASSTHRRDFSRTVWPPVCVSVGAASAEATAPGTRLAGHADASSPAS